MQELVREYLNEWKTKKRRRRRISIAVTLLVVMVAGTVIGALTQYGIAMTGDVYCGLEEHTHDESCYTDVAVCGQKESEGHTHGEECYDAEGAVICGQEESEGHTHTENCYEQELTCGKEEHVHTDVCYINTRADVEEASVWDEQYASVEWKGMWGEDLVTAARMQTGYKESTQNYSIAEDGSHKGYTRYGQFSGDIYTDWDAAFVNFCLYYAGLTGIEPKVFPDAPGEADTAKWREAFGNVREENKAFLTAPEGYEPEAGDIIFFHKENEETGEQMGIVSSYNKEEKQIRVIEGNSENEVKENTYDAGDGRIAGYLKLTELESLYKNPDGEETEVPAAEPENEGQKPDEETGQTPEEPAPERGTEQTPEVQPVEAGTEQSPESNPEEGGYIAYSRVADLDSLKVIEAGAATENVGETDAGAAAKDLGEPDNREDNTWSFDAYYVNQNDRTDIVKTSDFNLKYQMEFHTSRNFKANEIAVRVERKLFDFRNGDPVIPEQIAVPQVIREGDTERPVENKNMPFNYRVITDENGTEYLEFFNYREIPAGTNVAWQILYKNLKIMQIADEQEWKLNPQIIIWDTDGNGDPVYGTEKEKRPAKQLKGQIDSSVKLGSVTKKAYHQNGKQYTPELYTASQVRTYTENISSENEELFFAKDENGKEILNKDYCYAVWEVTMRGSATQPWEVQINETPGAGGMVVGYKDNFNEARGYDVSIDSEKALTENIAVAKNERTSWSSRFYVVTAYPAGSVQPDITEISNEIEIKAVPCDGKDEPEVKKADAEFVYKDFTWTYPDDAIGVEKNSDDEGPDHKEPDYTGWLEVYNRVGDDYGDIPFTSLGKFRGYGLTHETTGENLGQYKEGAAYKLITADDFMYVIDGEQYTMLDKDDYYYSGVSVTQRDYGYDIWEDAETAKPEINGNTDEQNVVIYAKFGGKGENDQWQEVARVPWDDSGVMSYTFSADDIARQPYRVKAEHVSTNYRTTCEIKVKVRIKKNAPNLQGIMEKYKGGTLSSIRFEDLSGVIAQTKNDDEAWTLTEVKKVEAGSDNYGEPGLIGATKDLYEELSGADTSDGNNFPMYRDNAYTKVTGLESHAKSSKAVTSITNDVTNRRGQVVYSLTAHDGYEIFSQGAVTELKRQGMESPGRKNLAFYDLLPEGMTFDPSYPVKAGRITNLDSRGNYKKQPGLWDGGQVNVTWETKDNYNGTSRTMVIFHIEYSGEDAAVYSSKSWMEGWGVSFRAYYDWEDTKLVQEGTNISAFMPDTTDPHYGDAGYPLLGTADEVAKDDGVIVPSDYKDVYQDFGENIDGNPANDDIPNVLYAENDESEDIAQNYNSAITKLVRADADKYSSYRTSAVVEEKGYYTYDIRVSTGSASLQNIIVYDHLENAAADRQNDSSDPNSGFENAKWKGTLQSVMTSGLEKLGVQPVVYYSTDRDAAMPQTREELAQLEDGKLENLKDSKGNQVWYTEEAFKNKIREEFAEYKDEDSNPLEKAASIAVDLRKNKEGEDFVLEAESSVSFRFRMQAPEVDSGDDNPGYAYNCPVYYSTSASDVDNGIRYGDSVKVSRKKAADLAVVKEFGSEVPDSVKDTSFEFILTDKRDAASPQPFSYQVYELYKKDAEGNWKSAPEAGQYATDGSGLLELQADEKAVFKKVADVSEIEVKERENIFWKSETEDMPAEEPGYIRTVTVTNTYRPVLYVEKKLEGVPEEVDIDALNPEFTFRVQAEKDGELVPLKGQEYYYVKEVRTDGGIPRIDTAKGTNGKGETAADGTFNIHKGEIIAVFPGSAGTKYEVKEVENASSGEDWICREDTVTGTVPVRGAGAVIRNYYRWRELYLTKEITHQTEELCREEFTFQIQKVENRNGTEETVPLTEEELSKLDLVMGSMEDGVFEEVSGREDSGTAFLGLLNASRALNVAGNGNEVLLPGISGNAVGEISVDSEGRFRCRCAGMTIRIRGLEAGKTYRITEIVSEGSLYLPEQGTVDVTMLFYSDKKEVAITNDYQMRPLSVTKKVVDSSGSGNDDTEFTMQILVNGEPLKNYPYRIQNSGVSGGGGMSQGGNQGMLSLGNSQNRLLSGAGSSLSAQAVNTEPAQNGRLSIIRPDGVKRTDGEGKITLKDGQTAILTDAGKLGDKFEVIETPAEGYLQIAPSGNGEGIFSGEGAEVTFVNAKEDEGRNLYISKVYETEQRNGTESNPAEDYVEDLKTANQTNNSDHTEAGKGSVEVTLTLNGQTFTGGDGKQVIVVNQLTGETSAREWNGPTFMLDPWSVVIIPIEGTDDISYTLSESKEDQHRIVEYSDGSGESNWLEISQKEPANDRPVEGTVAGNPVATITNEVTAVAQTSIVTKQMTEDSSEVPEGAELVWRVEEFNGVTWQPAEGVPYITLEGDWSKDLAGALAVPTCDRILRTGPDGRIVLTKSGSEDGADRWPAVYFAEYVVFVNKYEDADAGEYRVVEVMEESDEAWGMLKEYTASKKYTSGNDSGLDLSYYSAGGFINSNETAPIEIAKEMAEDSGETFTMILKQVLSLSKITDFNNIGEGWEQYITASEGRSGIPYTVYDTQTGEIVGEKETGKNGEIYLKAGQYARLNLLNTLWTVSEEVGHTYKLTNLTPESETKLKKLNDNLMLINGDFPRTYTVRYEDSMGDPVIEQSYSRLKEGDLTPEYAGGDPTKEGYDFMRWEPAVSSTVSAADDDDGDGVIVYQAEWQEKAKYTVTYTDGVIGETVFSDQGYENLIEGSATPRFVGTPSREGYKFDGWNPELSSTVSGENADEDNEIIYTAQWKKLYKVKYVDGVVDGFQVFGPETHGALVEGDKTPPFAGSTSRRGYTFTGWSPAVNDLVSGDDADVNGEIVYTATWKKD